MTADTRLRYAYNTNGLAHHRLDDALSLLADTGYHGVALTLDVHHLDPFAPDALAQAHRLRERCALVDSHGQHSYALAVEPEPGMRVQDCEDWLRLQEQVPGIALALDTGHYSRRWPAGCR